MPTSYSIQFIIPGTTLYQCNCCVDPIETWEDLIEHIKHEYDRVRTVAKIEKESLWPEIEERLVTAKEVIESDINTMYEIEIQDIIGIEDEYVFLRITRSDTV